MKKLFSYILAAILLQGVCVAQESSSTGILGLKMQKRYVPGNLPFKAHAFAEVAGGSYGAFLGGGYRFSPLHSARLSAGYDGGLAFRASYGFNLSAYVDGYNPSRALEVEPFAGFGLGPKVSLHTGVTVAMRIAPHLDLIFEPMVRIGLDGGDYPRFGTALSGGAGLRCRFLSPSPEVYPGEWFFSLSLAPQVQASRAVSRMGFFGAIGPGVQFGFGRRIAPGTSLRAVLGYGSHFWKMTAEEGEKFLSAYTTVGAHALFDILSFGSSAGLSLYAGPQAGYMIKEDRETLQDIRTPYFGVAAGARFTLGLYKGLRLFIEPGVSIVPYVAKDYLLDDYTNFYDSVLSLSVGLEYRTAKH